MCWLVHYVIIRVSECNKRKRKIDLIREENDKNLSNNDIKLKQISTAFYFIDNFALRVGNEKSSDETDTVGVTSLRIEHIELLEKKIKEEKMKWLNLKINY